MNPIFRFLPRGLVRYLLAGALVAACALFVRSTFERVQRGRDGEILRIGMDNLVRRVHETQQNYRALSEMSDRILAAQTRALADLIAADPTVLTDTNRLEGVCRDFSADAISVSDARGIVVAAVPSVGFGYDMNAHEQSRAFLPAITNRHFVLVQEARANGQAAQIVQYTGVARRDAPGIVQIGIVPNRIENTLRLADVGSIARNTRLGFEGDVTVADLEGLAEPPRALAIVTEDGRRWLLAERDVGANRVAIRMPLAGTRLGDDDIHRLLAVVLGVAASALVLSLLWGFAGAVRGAAQTFRDFAATAGQLKARYYLRHPATILGFAVYLAAMAAFWFVETRSCRQEALTVLRGGCADAIEDLTFVDDALFYVGAEICRRHPDPRAITHEQVREILDAYGLDEFNAVGSDGCVTASSIGIAGEDQWKKKYPAMFNQSLLRDGELTYAQAFRESADEHGVIRKYAGVAYTNGAGYVQLGFDHTRLTSRFRERFRRSAEGWHIGKTGYFICSDEEDCLVMSSGHRRAAPTDSLAAIGLAKDVLPPLARVMTVAGDIKYLEPFDAEPYGEAAMCMSLNYGFHRGVVALPYDEVFAGRSRTVSLASVALAVILTGVVWFFVRLSDAVHRLRGYIDAEKERQLKDLTLARLIQTSALPPDRPDDDRLRLRARMETAREVGGDFFDFYPLDDGRLVVLIADVSGKGVSAALFMMKAKAALRASLLRFPDLATAMADANDRLSENNDALMFVTAWVAVFDPRSGRLAYVNAGHNPPLVKAADGSVRWLKGRRSLVFGAQTGVKYRVEEFDLAPGDELFLYTDGVTEAMNPHAAQYGEARLEACLAKTEVDLIDAVFTDVTAFVNGAERSDDITMLTLLRKVRGA